MGNVSRPLIGLLVGTVAFFLLWVVALKPSSSSSGGSSGGVGQYQPAINQARKAVGVSNAASAAHGGTVPSNAPQTPSTSTTGANQLSPTPSTAAATANSATTSATTSTATTSTGASTRMNVVQRALNQHKVVAMLFYNTAGADDQAVNQELKSVPTRGSRVVKLAVPLSEIGQYSIVTSQVPVNVSPTLVLIDSNQHASTIVGFADRFEIAHRVSELPGS